METIAFEEYNLPAADGTPLFLREARVQAPKAEVVLVHGMGEHSARYCHVAEYLARHGYRLCAFDLRGHGRSGGERGDVETYATLLDDLDRVWRHYCRSGGPAFLYGHSVGGQIVLHFALRRKTEPAGVIITSPWLQLAFEPPRYKLALAAAAMKLWPKFAQTTGIHPERMSRDAEFLQSLRDLDLVHHRMSARMFFALREAAAKAMANAAEFNLPLLMIHGAADPITSARATEEFFHKTPSKDKTLRIYAGALHETHNDLDRNEVLREIVGWLEAHCRTAGAAAAQS